MGVIFAWLPMPAGPDEETWSSFLDTFAAIFIVLLLATVALAVFGYRRSANARRVYHYEDVFSAYTPMKWLWTALGGALITTIACAFTYKSATDTYTGMSSTCCEFFLLMLTLAFLFSYLIMAYGPVTPRKFAYRPAALLHHSGAKPGR